MITPIITIAEADVYLASYSDWLALSDEAKTEHIYNSSLAIQTGWVCLYTDGTPIDWTDTDNIPEEIKHASALYAYASSIGGLYGSVSDGIKEKLKRKMVKAGGVTVDKEFLNYSSTDSSDSSHLGLPNALLRLYCKQNNVGSETLIRV